MYSCIVGHYLQYKVTIQSDAFNTALSSTMQTHIHVHVATCIKVNVNHILISSISQYMNYFTDPRRLLKEQCTCRCMRFRFELKFNF